MYGGSGRCELARIRLVSSCICPAGCGPPCAADAVGGLIDSGTCPPFLALGLPSDPCSRSVWNFGWRFVCTGHGSKGFNDVVRSGSDILSDFFYHLQAVPCPYLTFVTLVRIGVNRSNGSSLLQTLSFRLQHCSDSRSIRAQLFPTG
ncbi:hypothetical protein N656DRAFT_442045 [Canariomyces notabilis]|uniref:Uncharacterized protein n=1 Tax=Canariomyces notabilis TaxID=2074819 RepID=A0AAN6QEI5_9PEZI|nr:hypothetical protein N656DRAFT_442045 [Canariomyces arenarius]